MMWSEAVGEHFECTEAGSARTCGALGRENVGMSNHISNEKLDPRKSKVSVAMAINHGLGDPKAMVRTAADGKPVNIPARAPMCDGVTEEKRLRVLMVWRRALQEMYSWKIRNAAFNGEFR